MIFKEIFELLEKKMSGLEGAVVIDDDGVSLDSYVKKGSSIDIENIGVEAAVISKNLKRFSESLNIGLPEEFIFKTDKYFILARFISEQLTYCAVMDINQPVGKGRFHLKTTSWKMIKKI